MYLGIEVTLKRFPCEGSERPNARTCAREIGCEDLHRLVFEADKFPRTSDEQKLAVLRFLGKQDVEFIEQDGRLKVWNSAELGRSSGYRDYLPVVTGIYEVGIVYAESHLTQGQIPTQVLYIKQPDIPAFRLVQLTAITTDPENFTLIKRGTAIARRYEAIQR